MTVLEKLNRKLTSYSAKAKNHYFRFLKSILPDSFGKDLGRRVHSLGYAYPDELFLNFIPDKSQVWAEIIPGFRETYRFNNEEDYYKSYQDAKFAFTWKKGGWDCLRHYEIIANACLPVFRDIDKCPNGTLDHLPKEIFQTINEKLLPWKGTESQELLYSETQKKLIEKAKKNASCSGLASRFLTITKLKKSAKVLFLICDERPNYSREFTFIGLNRALKKGGGICLSYPRLDALYEDFPQSKAQSLYGMGFGYTRKLVSSPDEDRNAWNDDRIIQSINESYWDFILFGKVGLDETKSGGIPHLPFWDFISTQYDASKIGFIYGGDHIQKLSDWGSPHTRHLLKHANRGHCFVRELDIE